MFPPTATMGTCLTGLIFARERYLGPSEVFPGPMRMHEERMPSPVNNSVAVDLEAHMDSALQRFSI